MRNRFVIKLLLLGMVSATALGCGWGEYDQRMESRINELKSQSGDESEDEADVDPVDEAE